MKKQFTILLIFVFIFELIPVNFSLAITQNQINAEVQIVCTDGQNNWFSGSGTIIDPKGIILRALIKILVLLVFYNQLIKILILDQKIIRI